MRSTSQDLQTPKNCFLHTNVHFFEPLQRNPLFTHIRLSHIDEVFGISINNNNQTVLLPPTYGCCFFLRYRLSNVP